MTKYIVECSECRLYYSHESDAQAQEVADQHERETGHKGPFMWTMTDALRALIDRSLNERWSRYPR